MNNQKEKLLYETLSIFFKKSNNINQILPIISGSDKISLRLLDWFITNYTKYNIIQYPIVKNGKTIHFLVHLHYKAQLKAYSKKLFDPFCRRKRIYLKYDPKDDTKTICTTIGQLNFFKWAIENKVINYLRENLQDIENDMNNNNMNKQKICKTKQMSKREVVIVLTFN